MLDVKYLGQRRIDSSDLLLMDCCLTIMLPVGITDGERYYGEEI